MIAAIVNLAITIGVWYCIGFTIATKWKNR
jgi:hypothetical protein